MPPLVLASAAPQSGQALIFGCACRTVLSREDNVSVLADDFVRGKSGETFRSNVPIDHVARPVLREHRKVHGAFEDQPEQVSIFGRLYFRIEISHFRLQTAGKEKNARGEQ